MAARKRQSRDVAETTPARSSRTTRRTTQANEGAVPNVFKDLLAEAAKDGSDESPDRPLKRRKVQSQPGTSSLEGPQLQLEPEQNQLQNQLKKPALSSASPRTLSKVLQTVEDSSDSDESDFAFEDVDLDLPSQDQEDDIQDVSISLEPESTSKRQVNRRKPVSAAEKSHRVFVHKLHILCLLQHCNFVNGRCNNTAVHRRLRPLLNPKVVSFLNPKSEHGQFQRNSEFLDGLKQAMTTFATNYRVVSSGLSRPRWDLSETDVTATDYGDAIDRAAFLTAAKELEGSQDTGNQLFCALLRAAGVETRLICSLPVLSFSNPGKPNQPQKVSKPTIYVDVPGGNKASKDENSHDTSVQSSTSIGKVPSVRRRLGNPGFNPVQPQVLTRKPKPVRQLTYPIFWVEAFNTAHQKWVPVDPIVTHTVGKPGKFEPPLTYGPNQMTYVVAFEGNGVARDVTKRYAKAYNAKTRRHRIEATGEDGLKWWKRVSKIFRRRGDLLDRDQVEDSELAQKEAREGMPGNVQDFKDHPYYALERHMKRHEVIHPKREAGKVNAGTAANPRMEPVFRRQDVQICRSADKWYRLGRVIQKGEQPIKQVPARVKKREAFSEDDQEDISETTGLYAPYQTEHYVPPPVQRGRITKNVYGNLDVYVPSMVPAGGTHIRHSLAKQAAKLLRIDYADAVTGFQFKGRHGTAIIEGVVVAEQFGDAVRAAIEGFEDDAAEDESRARSLQALRLWKRFLVGLRIAERVKTYDDGSTGEVAPGDVDDELEKMDSVQEAGGFLSGEADETPLPTAGHYTAGELSMRAKSPKRRPKRTVSSDEEDDLASVSESDGASVPENKSAHANTHDNYDGGGGGGFFVEEDQSTTKIADDLMTDVNQTGTEDDDFGGGFLVEDDDDDHNKLFEEENNSDTKPSQTPKDTSAPSAVRNNDHSSDQGIVDDESSTADQTLDAFVQKVELTSIDANETQNNALQPSEAGEHIEDDEATSDKGSMISHDPEDEDLEPDWLESD